MITCRSLLSLGAVGTAGILTACSSDKPSDSSASGAPAVAEDYDPFLRPSRSEGRKEPGAPASSQESDDETGSGDKG